MKPTRPGVAEFIIRINALDFKSLQDRMLRPISILDGVTFNKTAIDRFIEVFKQQIQLNPKYTTDEVSDYPFGMFTFRQLKQHDRMRTQINAFSIIVFRWQIYVLRACKQNQT